MNSPDNEARTSFKSIVNQHCPNLKLYEQIYENIHDNPELGFQESHTASFWQRSIYIDSASLLRPSLENMEWLAFYTMVLVERSFSGRIWMPCQ